MRISIEISARKVLPLKFLSMVEHLMRHRVLDVYVQCLDVRHDMTLPETLLSDSEDVQLEGIQASRNIVELDDNTSDDSSDSGKDDEEMLADIPFIDHNSDTDDEREEARDKMRRFVQLRRAISQDADEGNDTDVNVPGENDVNTPEHSCLLGTSRNGRVSAQVIANRFGDVICSVPSMKSTQLKAMVRKELGVFITEKAPNTNPQDEAEPSLDHANVVSSSQRQNKGGKIGKRNNAPNSNPQDGVGPAFDHVNVVSSTQRQKGGATLEGKEKNVGTQGSLKVIKGACTNEIILGREAPHHASFITAAELYSTRLVAQQKKNKTRHGQTSVADVDTDTSATSQSCLDLPTQASATTEGRN
ncbi:hypothetical protein J5N97_013473 [Dioscorea zingiberensis]|uniref:Uncharacterized protein n=1 Tax=Dioscorea zingiberensis TaxID=325984 RepID=A0A9D5CSA3_9LILI|nr:hypothetical protein J5N97_013473 [Dioscorea zingiberensis]